LEQVGSTTDYQAMLRDTILKMDFQAFSQIVMLATAGYEPFLNLSVSKRREFVEKFLDIEIFTKLNKVIKKDAQINSAELLDYQKDIISTDREIALLKSYIEDISRPSDNKELLELVVKTIRKYFNEYKSYEVELKELNIKLESNSMNVDSDRIEEITTQISKLENNILYNNNEVKSISNKIKFFDSNPTCPTCAQSVDISHKDEHIKDYTNNQFKLTEENLRATKEIESLKTELVYLQDIQNSHRKLQTEISDITKKMQWLKNQMNEKYKEKLELEKIPAPVDVSSKEQELVELEIRRKELQKTYDEILTESKYFGRMLVALKDSGAKTEIINNYVPVMCEYVNRTLEELNLYLKFELDGEFNETLKARHRDSRKFESFSFGERMRLNLAILWAWREIAKQRTGVSTNLLAFDEVLEIFDIEGFEELLSKVEMDDKLNCVIITHKTGIDHLFDKTIHVKNVKGFTQIETE